MHRDRATIAASAAIFLRGFAARADGTRVLLGFDGFVDSIIDVVERRHDGDRYERVPTIARFAAKLAAAAGQSGNYELVTRLQKLGGNGPIMANALASAGLGVTYIGALGDPKPHPAFEGFCKVAKVHSVLQPGMTDALEFEDGKLMLGKIEHLEGLNQALLDEKVGREAFRRMLSDSRLLAMVNWTMLGGMRSIWEALLEEVLPSLGEGVGVGAGGVGATLKASRPMIFVDLADPEKRSDEDLLDAMGMLSRFTRYTKTVLGLNLKESLQALAVLGLRPPADPAGAPEEIAVMLRGELGLYGVVVHPRHAAAAALAEPGGEEVASATFEGPFTRRPALSTGAGDNFNAGFCLGLLAGMGVEEALCTGTATSGFYVRQARSPSLEELAAFCDHLPEAEGGAGAGGGGGGGGGGV